MGRGAGGTRTGEQPVGVRRFAPAAGALSVLSVLCVIILAAEPGVLSLIGPVGLHVDAGAAAEVSGVRMRRITCGEAR